MTCKKIDWLRHLYYESTRWLNSLTGQVKWREMTAKDPNNGSKMTVKDLEATLPNMLQDCLRNKSVPSAYRPEVEYFLTTTGYKIDNAVLPDLVQSRKRVLAFKDSFEMLDQVSLSDKMKIVQRLDTASIYMYVKNLVTVLQAMGVQACREPLDVQDDDRSSKFKLIDWLRHMYLMCQKWLNNEAGQVQWKKLNTQDPNNSKDGKRMKLEELKDSLKVLVPGLQDDIVPKPYMAEIAIMRKVLCCNEGKFINKDLSAEEHLRKVSLKVEDVFEHLGDPQTVLGAMEPSQLPWVLSVVLRFKEQLETTCKAVPDFLENEIPEEAVDEVEFLDEVEIQEIKVKENEVEEGPSELLNEGTDPVDDGTRFLMDIINQQSEVRNDPPSDVTAESPTLSNITNPLSPVFPFSPDRQSVDEQLSDDSGYHSPKRNNPQDLKDLEEFNSIDRSGLDCISLRDDCLSEEELETSTNNEKRRLSDKSSNPLSPVRHSMDEQFLDDSQFEFLDLNNPLDLEHPEELEDIASDIVFSDLDFTCFLDVYLPEKLYDFSTSNKKRRLLHENDEDPPIKRANTLNFVQLPD